MSQYIKYEFPPANTQDVCLSQTTTGAMNLVLNGNLAIGNDSNNVSFINYGYSRQISFTSTGNLSTFAFTIVGTQNGVPVVETINAGPNANTVYSVNIYDVITSISTTGALTSPVQVGTGYLGFFNLINLDLNPPNITPLYPYDIDYSISLGSLASTNQIPVTIYTTLDTISGTGVTFKNLVTANTGSGPYNLNTIYGPTAANLYTLPVSPVTSVPIVNSILIALTGTTSTLGNGVTMIFIQQ